MSRFTVLCVSLVLLCACPARADSSDAARSVEKADAGLALYEKRDWSGSLASFREAEALYHSPVYVLYMAKCLEQLGHFTEAKREYERVAGEVLPPSAPEPWQKAKDEGKTALSSLDERFPSIRIEVHGASTNTRVSVDDRDVLPGATLNLDPGSHRIAAVDGARRASRDVTLEAGQKDLRVVLSLPAPTKTQRARVRPRPATKRGPNVPGLWLTIAGSAVVVGGAVTGVVALQKADDARNDLPDSCRDTTCPESQRGAVEDRTRDARRFATISDGLFIGGGALLTAGVLLLILDPGAEPEATLGASRGILHF
jgi:hypothetical protein